MECIKDGNSYALRYYPSDKLEQTISLPYFCMRKGGMPNYFDDVNKKDSATVIWLVGVIRKYEDEDFLVSVYDRSEEQIRNQFIESDKVFSGSTKSWTIT